MTLLTAAEESAAESGTPVVPIETGDYRDFSGWWERYCAASG